LAQICTILFVGWGFAPDPLAGLKGGPSGNGRGRDRKGGGEER